MEKNNEESRADHEHMAALLAGDAESWAKLYDRHHGAVLRFCGNFTEDYQTAQDWAQEAFLKLKEKAPTFQPGAELKPWLYKLARNICLDALRKRREVPWTDSVFAATISCALDSGPSPSTCFENVQMDRQALQALSTLSEEHRSVLLLKYVEGLTREEIAAAMDVPVATVKSRLYYAMNAVRKEIDISN